MALKAAEIRAFPALDTPYRKTDEKGLYLEVHPKGSKTWYFKYRFAGKEKRMSFGPWPEVSLVEARDLRDKNRRKVRQGIDPLLERKMDKIAAGLATSNSFKAVADDFIEVRLVGSQKAQGTIDKAKWFLEHLEAGIGHRPVSEIQPVELLIILKNIERDGKRETARRTRAFASRVFRHGVALSMCKEDPAALLGDALALPIVKHHAAILEPGKLGELMRSVDDFGGSITVKTAMQLIPHVFTRPCELRFGRWEEINWDESIWLIPGERMKLRRPHSVPLSTQAIALLKELQRHTGWMEYMFTGERSHKKPISENAINAAFRRMGFDQETVTAHGFRATASTFLNESGKWHPDAIERALAHGHSNAVRGVYARGQHWDERVEMAQWWSDYLDTLKTGAEIVPMRRYTQSARPV